MALPKTRRASRSGEALQKDAYGLVPLGPPQQRADVGLRNSANRAGAYERYRHETDLAILFHIVPHPQAKAEGLASLAGFEPATRCLEGSRSVQLSYRDDSTRRSQFSNPHLGRSTGPPLRREVQNPQNTPPILLAVDLEPDGHDRGVLFEQLLHIQYLHHRTGELQPDAAETPQGAPRA